MSKTWVFSSLALFLVASSVGFLGCVKHPPPTTRPPTPSERVAGQSKKTLRFQAVGDLNLGGRTHEMLEIFGYDYPFGPTLGLLREGDINFANLESPITDRGAAVAKEFTFRMPPAIFPHIRAAGFQAFSLANNHIMDYGVEGLKQTIEVIRKGGGVFAGAGENLEQARQGVIWEVNAVRVGLLAYSLTHPESFYAQGRNPGTAFGHEAHVRQDVKRLRPQVELLVVSFHWGAEKRKTPKPYQIALAHASVEAGADLVLGHHPHVVQGVEVYQEKPIFYSLGNYAFGSYSNHVQWGMLARTTWEIDHPGQAARLRQLEVVPLNVNNFAVDFAPEVLTGKGAEKALTELQDLSAPLQTHFHQENERAVLRLGFAERADGSP